MKQLFIPFPVLFLFFVHFTPISAQAPAAAPAAPAAPLVTPPAVPLVAPPAVPLAAAPAPAGPTDLTSILKKDGRFTIFIRLLQSTKVADNINSQLTDGSNNGLTVFAPTDGAFSSLKTGTLNSLTDEQKTELVQFHVLPSYLPPSQFQTVSNPLTTQAGSSSELFAMNVTMPPPPPSPPPPKKAAPKAPAYVSPAMAVLSSIQSNLLAARSVILLPQAAISIT